MHRLRPSLLALLLLGGSGCGEDLNVGRADLDEGLDAATGADADTRDRAADDRLEQLALDVGGDWVFAPPPFGNPLARLRLAPKPGTRSGEWALECLDPICMNRPKPPDAGPWVDALFAYLDRPKGTYWFLEFDGGARAEGLVLAADTAGVKFAYDVQADTLAWGSDGFLFTRSRRDGGAP